MWQGKRLGILGGGQLGAMLIRSAIDFGLKVSVLDKHADAPCAHYASSFSVGDPMCYETVLAFGRTVDVLTIEKEAVNVKALQQLEREGIRVHPSASVIGLIQDKWIQKGALQLAGVPIVPGLPILNRNDLRNYSDKLPACLKRCTSGYDGKGVMMLHTQADIEAAFDAPCVLEELIDIRQELSVIVARSSAGEVACYDPVLMIFNKERRLLDYQFCPADVDETLAMEARDIAVGIAQTIELVGILAVEMFITADGRLLVNELAPRPHNSGHHTIEASATSQYEQQLRAILGLPLGDTSMQAASMMINVLEPAAKHRSSLQDALQAIMKIPCTHLHWYGKQEGHEGRKMGHITVTASNAEDAFAKGEAARRLLNGLKESVYSHVKSTTFADAAIS